MGTRIGNTSCNWDEIQSIPYHCTVDTKLKAFKLKFLMKILQNNVYLQKCISQLCDGTRNN